MRPRFGGSGFIGRFNRCLLLSLLPLSAALATDNPWTGATSTDWGNNGNWTGGKPGGGDSAVFNSTFSNQPIVGNGQTVGAVHMTGSIGQNVTISGAGQLTINAISGAGILVDNTNAFSLTISVKIKVGNDQTWTNNSGNLLTISGPVDIDKEQITVQGTGNTLISGIISDNSNATGIVKAGSGLLTLTGVNTYTGPATVNGGTMLLSATGGPALSAVTTLTVNSGGTVMLGASDQVRNAAAVSLGGGTFAKGNFSEGTASAAGMGALTLTATGSHIDFGTGTVGILSFASFTANARTLTIDNWTGIAGTVGNIGTDRLIFNADQTANLSAFNFTGYNGAMQFNLGGGFFEVVPATPVPEPSTWTAGLLVLGTLVYAGFKRRQRLIKISSLRIRRSNI